MFNWLKNLFSSKKLLPNDVESGLMTSMFYSVKLGEKLIVPDNCVCYLSYKDKVYNQFESGNYTLDEQTLNSLITKQTRGKKEIKTVKFDLFYVNKNKFNYDTKQNESIPFDGRLSKVEIKTNFDCQVVDTKKFKSYALSFFALIRPIDAENLVKSFVTEHINKYYLKHDLFSPINAETETENIKTYLNKKAERYGFTFANLYLSLWVKNKTKQPVETEKSFFDDVKVSKTSTVAPIETIKTQKEAKTETENIDNTKSKEYNLNNVGQSVSTNENKEKKQEVCPQCQSIRIANSAFCHKCGYKFL